MHLQCLTIKNYGCTEYVDDPLPNIYIAPAGIISPAGQPLHKREEERSGVMPIICELYLLQPGV